MFFKFAAWNEGLPLTKTPSVTAIRNLTKLHPQLLLTALEQFYSTRPAPPADAPDYRLPKAPEVVDAPSLRANMNSALPGLRWDHAIYAYMVENTRIFEIFDRVLREYESGERFETPEGDAALWLRSTEALFYRELGSGFIGSLTSSLRPDARAIRRNTYYRLLGLDLNHGTERSGAYPFEKPPAANRDFVLTFEAFLREVWRGSMNASNTSGANDTDNEAIADHARRVREMLNVRRLHGSLGREEFWSVVTMSWFHLAVAENTPIVLALKADAESPADRLRKLGDRIGIPAHSRSDAYFNMAFELSTVLTFIESDPTAVQPAMAPGYYMTTGPYALLANDVKTIITHWSLATGRELKAQRVMQSAVLPSVGSARLLGPGNGRQAALTAT